MPPKFTVNQSKTRNKSEFLKSKYQSKEKSIKSMDSPVESPICHAERVIFADKPNLPRSLRLSSDKQTKQELSFSRYKSFYDNSNVFDLTLGPTLVVAVQPC